MGQTIKMSKLINPHFYRLWRTSKPYVVAKGDADHLNRQ